MLTRILLRTGQIAASLASLSRTVDDYSALSKKELIPEKQEKAFERVKNFRGELGEYRQEFDHMRKTREDAVCSGPPSPSLRARSELTNGVTLKKAIHVKPQRAPKPSGSNANRSNRPAKLKRRLRRPRPRPRLRHPASAVTRITRSSWGMLCCSPWSVRAWDLAHTTSTWMASCHGSLLAFGLELLVPLVSLITSSASGCSRTSTPGSRYGRDCD